MVERTSELESTVERFRRELERLGVRPERILLFGSHARGQAREGSDIDLVVISPDWSRFGRRERLELLGEAAAHIMESVQAQGFTPDEIDSGRVSSFWQEILLHEAIPV